jgi:uncharacterized protein YpmS
MRTRFFEWRLRILGIIAVAIVLFMVLAVFRLFSGSDNAPLAEKMDVVQAGRG